MADKSRVLKLNILADTKELVKGLDKANKEVGGAGSKMSDTFKKVGVAVAAAAAAAGAFAIKYGKDAVKAASDLSETVAKTGEIFGASAKQVEDFAATAAKTLGQSKQQALDAASTFAIFGKSAGLAGDDLVKFSTDFTVLASDLASFNNTSPDEAILAIGSALRGEAEPLRRYGVLLDDASLRQAALELGIISTTKNALTPQQKVLAAQALIYKQTGDAQGDFARTSDGLANSQRILEAQLANVQTVIGTALLPIVLDLVTLFSTKVLPIIEKFAKFLSQDLIPTIKNNTIPAIEAFIRSLFNLSTAFGNSETSARKFNFSLSEAAFGTNGFVTVTINAGTRIVQVWTSILDILNRVRAFIVGDLDTALRKWDNQFKENNKTVNNVNESVANGYRQLRAYNQEVNESAIPSTNALTNSYTGMANAATTAAGATKALTAAKQQLSALSRETAALQAGGAIPSAISGDLKSFYKSELSLISSFGGLIEGINLKPTDPFYGFGQGGNVNQAIQQRQSGSATATGGNVTINVNGTVIDPEGAARAISKVITESAVRGGVYDGGLGGYFGLELK